MVDIGIVDPETSPNAWNESDKSWEKNKFKTWEAAHMEAHAAMVDRVDQGVGKVIAKLKETGEWENTVIFILSDNGASPERVIKPGFDRPAITREGQKIEYFLANKYPDRMKQMAKEGHKYAEKVGYDPNAKGPTR